MIYHGALRYTQNTPITVSTISILRRRFLETAKAVAVVWLFCAVTTMNRGVGSTAMFVRSP